MDLSLTGEQEDVQDLLTHLLQREVPLDTVRGAEPLGFDAGVWDRLMQAGIPGMGAPEELGGGGADLDILVPAAEALGRALTPAPVIEHLVAVRALARTAPGHPLLGHLVSGSTIACFAPRPARRGVAPLVPGGAVAGVVVALDGDELVLVSGPPPADPPVNFGSAPLADRSLDDAGRTVLASGPSARDAFAGARDEWRILTAAALVGLAAGALDLAVGYVKERTQFGVAIGSFQSIQHGLADLPGQIDGGRLLVHEAAWCATSGQLAATGATGPELASMAFLFVGEVARTTTAACVQYHGGMGYAEEGDAQLYFRRARGWPLALGDPGAELDHLADQLLEPRKAS
jgi:alkylation response protein AidB-like acyl-CoA dehydrogenase